MRHGATDRGVRLLARLVRLLAPLVRLLVRRGRLGELRDQAAAGTVTGSSTLRMLAEVPA